MVNLTIDGRKLQAEAGRTVLQAARDNKIAIPTLCYHEGLPAYGACRLCIVSIERHGRERLVVSCLFPVEEGLLVKTSTPRVDGVRRMVLDLLLARCPDSDVIRDLAVQYGVEKSSFRPESGNNKCILCALCTRVCQDTVGASAISLVNRGVERKVATPFETFSESCIACGSCAFRLSHRGHHREGRGRHAGHHHAPRDHGVQTEAVSDLRPVLGPGKTTRVYVQTGRVARGLLRQVS